jgi:hypothetical protein
MTQLRFTARRRAEAGDNEGHSGLGAPLLADRVGKPSRGGAAPISGLGHPAACPEPGLDSWRRIIGLSGTPERRLLELRLAAL